MPTPPTAPCNDNCTDRLLDFNVALLDQALAIVAAHRAPGGPDYAGPVGAHLRHVVEHYEALLFAPRAGVVDYDSRPRDPLLERDAPLASRRLSALQARLRSGLGAGLQQTLQVRGLAGSAGEFVFEVPSSLDRELAFLASHTVHHFALMQSACRQRGIALGEHFGQAPATVAHALATARPVPNSCPPQPTEESSCPTLVPTL